MQMPYIFDTEAGLAQALGPVAQWAGTEQQRRPGKPGGNGRQQMVRLLKLVVVLAVLAFVGLVGYAYLGDLTPTPQDVRQPVAIDAG